MPPSNRRRPAALILLALACAGLGVGLFVLLRTKAEVPGARVLHREVLNSDSVPGLEVRRPRRDQPVDLLVAAQSDDGTPITAPDIELSTPEIPRSERGPAELKPQGTRRGEAVLFPGLIRDVWTLSARAAGHLGHRGDIEIPSATDERGVGQTVTLSRLSRLQVRVIDDREQPMVGARVEFENGDFAASGLLVPQEAQVQRKSLVGETDQAGAHVFEALPANRPLLVVAKLDGVIRARSDEILLQPGEYRRIVMKSGPESAVVGRFAAPTSPDEVLAFLYETGVTLNEQEAKTSCDPDGRFVIESGVVSFRLEPGEHKDLGLLRPSTTSSAISMIVRAPGPQDPPSQVRFMGTLWVFNPETASSSAIPLDIMLPVDSPILWSGLPEGGLSGALVPWQERGAHTAAWKSMNIQVPSQDRGKLREFVLRPATPAEEPSQRAHRVSLTASLPPEVLPGAFNGRVVALEAGAPIGGTGARTGPGVFRWDLTVPEGGGRRFVCLANGFYSEGEFVSGTASAVKFESWKRAPVVRLSIVRPDGHAPPMASVFTYVVSGDGTVGKAPTFTDQTTDGRLDIELVPDLSYRLRILSSGTARHDEDLVVTAGEAQSGKVVELVYRLRR